MFPPSLQKNIRELDRQISLLETECEHMEAKKKETTPTGKTSPKTIRELPNQSFITGHSASESLYSPRMLVLPPVAPKLYSASCAHFKTINEKATFSTEPQNNRSNVFESVKSPEDKTKITDAPSERTRRICTPRNSYYENSTLEESKALCEKNPKTCIKQRPINSIEEVSESSDENTIFLNEKSTKNTSGTWNVLNHNLTKNKTPRTDAQSQYKSKFSSDEENTKSTWFDEIRSEKLLNSERPITPRQKIYIRRRPRSARTKKNSPDEVPLDVNITKAWHEKEIQCMLWNEETEKAEFLDNLNDSIRTLNLLIGELKLKSSRERRDDVLNDMQNTLMKISKIKSMNTVHNPLIMLDTLKRNNFNLLEGEENFLDLKKTLLGVKQFCQELNDEKTALTEEISAQNRSLVTLKNKEKEYLSVISSLKFNLEKMKEEAEDGARARRDLNMVKSKLQEETKVIEALKKSHEKLQELVENYALENDKLKAQVKLTKLETQKFTVLLAGKEVEINKYKKEIESFQKQITQQLSLLRSRAAENEIECAMEAINNQTTIFESVKVNRSETITDKNDFNEKSNLESSETTSESSSVQTRPNQLSKVSEDVSGSGSKKEQKADSITGNSSHETKKTEKTVEDDGNDSESEVNSGRQYGLQRVLSSSKNLRSSINELLEDIRREKAEKNWPVLTNSCQSSSQTTLISITSDDASEGS